MLRSTLVLLLVATLAGPVLGQTARDLWPAATGNRWDYEAVGGIATGQANRIEVTAGRGSWARIEGFLDSNWWWMSPRSGKTYVWDGRAGRATPYFDLGVGTGGTFTSWIGTNSCVSGIEWTLVDASATVETPAGRFENCVEVRITRPNCADIGFDYVVFAPQVGIVEYGGATRAGVVRRRLVGAVVDGRVYTRRAEGLTVTVSIDRASYPVPPRRRPVPIVAVLEIANGTNQSVPIEHGSSQEYDFAILDENGREVWRWSDGRMFHRVYLIKPLAPGESRRWSETIDLSSLGGVPLPAGRYVLEATHVTRTSAALRSSARVVFSVE